MALLYILCAVIASLLLVKGETIKFYAEEEISGSQILGNIINTVNTSNLTGYSFDINTNEYSTYFTIDTNSNLYLSQKVDREALCGFQLICKINIQIWATLSSSVQVVDAEIIVMDRNDNTPTFSQSPVNLNIAEGTPIGTSYELTSVVDNDIGNNSIQQFLLLPEDAKFGMEHILNPDGTYSMFLVLNLNLDREIQDGYSLQVLAIDGGTQPLTGSLAVNINVTDINDNRPVFDPQRYNVTINEDISIGTDIVTVTATDRDIGENGRISYSITKMDPPSIQGKISISESSGRISLTETLNSETGPFTLYIEARDHGYPVKKSFQAEVKIYLRDINNNSPEIYVNTLNEGKDYAKVTEHADIGTLVAIINVRDSDTGENGEAICTCDNPSFSINNGATNVFSIHVATDLDREFRDIYNVTINCTDKGVPALFSVKMFQVRVNDKNDNAPQFERATYALNVPENNAKGAVLLRVSATDGDIGLNAKIRYSIEPFANRAKFLIGEDDGIIKADSSFDRETRSSYTFSIKAIDNGSNPLFDLATVNITILDINDNSPEFNGDSYAMSVLENSNVSKSIGQVTATDKDLGDNGTVSYSIPSDYSSYPFAVLDDGTVITTQELDREFRNLYQFEIVAADHGASPKATRVPVHVTVLDVNDNAPMIEFPYGENNTVELAHNTMPDSIITTVKADDEDEKENSRLSYRIIAGNDEQLFRINVDTGDIILTRTITNGDVKQFTLTISVKDNGVQPLEMRGTLHISVVMAPVPGDASQVGSSGQNILIAIVIGCVTFVLSLLIIVIICIIKRKDRQNKLYSAKAYDERKIIPSETNRSSNRSFSSKGSQDKMLYPNEGAYMENGYARKMRNKVSFSMDETQDTGISTETSTDQFDPVTFKSPSPLPTQTRDFESYEQDISPPRSEKSDDTKHRELNRMKSFQVQQALVQSNNNNKQWPQQTQGEDGYWTFPRRTSTNMNKVSKLYLTPDESRSPNTSSSHPFYTSENVQPPSFTSFHGNLSQKTDAAPFSSFLKMKQNRQKDDKHNNPSGNVFHMNDLSNPTSAYNKYNHSPYRTHSDAGMSPRNLNYNVEPSYPSSVLSSFGKVSNTHVDEQVFNGHNTPRLSHGMSYEESMAGMSQDDDNTTTTSGSFTLPDLHDEMLANDHKDMFYKPDTFV